MSGLGAFALGAAPLAGGLLVGGMAGSGGPNAPDLRAVIKSELDLLERIPEDQVTRRAALEQVIAAHIDALVVAIEKSRQLQRRISYLTENWRDVVLFLTSVLFTVVAWHADHHRPVWLPIIIAAILMSVVTALYVLRGFLRHVRPAPHGDHDRSEEHTSELQSHLNLVCRLLLEKKKKKKKYFSYKKTKKIKKLI